MLVFGVYINDKRIKKLQAVNVDTIFRNFNKYAVGKGYAQPVLCTKSFGNAGYANSNGDVIFLVPENV